MTGAATIERLSANFPMDAMTRTPAKLTVGRVEGLKALEALADDWQALERRSSRPVFFQSAAWCLHAARYFAEARAGRFEPLVITVRSGRSLVALAPFRVERIGPLRLAIDIAAPFGQYGDVLTADGCDQAMVAAAVLEALRASGRVDALVMRRVRADSPIHDPFLAAGLTVGEPGAAPFVALDRHATFEAYLKTVNAKTRKNLRNLRNRLGREATVEHRVFGPEDLAEALELAFEGRLNSLEEQGMTSTAFMDGGFRAFVHGLAELPPSRRVPIAAMGLYAGDAPVALQWGFVHQGRYYAYIAARNPQFDPMSPGKLHLEDVLHALKDRGVEVADLLAPAVRYKYTWTESDCAVGDIAVPLTPAGRLYVVTWLRRLRPLARRIFLALPLPLRKLAGRLLGGRRRAAATGEGGGAGD